MGWSFAPLARAFVFAVGMCPVLWSGRAREKVMYCRECDYRGNTRITTEGSLAVEVILWLLFIIPGLFYTSWRSAHQYAVCPRCGAKGMLLLGAPSDIRILART